MRVKLTATAVFQVLRKYRISTSTSMARSLDRPADPPAVSSCCEWPEKNVISLQLRACGKWGSNNNSHSNSNLTRNQQSTINAASKQTRAPPSSFCNMYPKKNRTGGDCERAKNTQKYRTKQLDQHTSHSLPKPRKTIKLWGRWSR